MAINTNKELEKQVAALNIANKSLSERVTKLQTSNSELKDEITILKHNYSRLVTDMSTRLEVIHNTFQTKAQN